MGPGACVAGGVKPGSPDGWRGSQGNWLIAPDVEIAPLDIMYHDHLLGVQVAFHGGLAYATTPLEPALCY